MPNNSTALYFGSRDLVVLDDKGEKLSQFEIPDYPYDLVTFNGYIVANMASGLICFNHQGNVCWRIPEVETDSKNYLGFDKNGFYVLHTKYNESFDQNREPDGNILGIDVTYVPANEKDLYIAHVLPSGELHYDRLIAKGQEPLNKPIITPGKIIIPFISRQSKGFHVTDLEARVLATEHVNITKGPLAVMDNEFVYHVYEWQQGKITGARLKGYGLSQLTTTFDIEMTHKNILLFDNTNQFGCVTIGDYMFMKTENSLLRFDRKTRKMQEFPCKALSMASLAGKLVLSLEKQGHFTLDFYSPDFNDLAEDSLRSIKMFNRPNLTTISEDKLLVHTKEDNTLLDAQANIIWEIQRYFGFDKVSRDF